MIINCCVILMALKVGCKVVNGECPPEELPELEDDLGLSSLWRVSLV